MTNCIEKDWIDSIRKLLNDDENFRKVGWRFSETILLIIEADESAENTLSKLIEFEKSLGRTKVSDVYESRVIDLDILFFNNEIIETKDLQIPHPRLHQRKFTLIPLNDIASDIIHPVLRKPVKSILKECEDSSNVQKCNSQE